MFQSYTNYYAKAKVSLRFNSFQTVLKITCFRIFYVIKNIIFMYRVLHKICREHFETGNDALWCRLKFQNFPEIYSGWLSSLNMRDTFRWKMILKELCA